jgi:hypothetical protein
VLTGKEAEVKSTQAMFPKRGRVMLDFEMRLMSLTNISKSIHPRMKETKEKLMFKSCSNARKKGQTRRQFHSQELKLRLFQSRESIKMLRMYSKGQATYLKVYRSITFRKSQVIDKIITERRKVSD